MAIDYAASSARIVVLGLCMQSDNYFSYVYSKEDFEKVIDLIVEKQIDPSQLITKKVGLNEFPTAFHGLK